MKDSFGRNIDYMRISITDRCNLRCCYCMPDESVQPAETIRFSSRFSPEEITNAAEAELLSPEEITNTAEAGLLSPEEITNTAEAGLLSFDEVEETVRTAAGLGITRFKVTGGEPLLREGCSSLIERLHSIPGVEQVTLTTNGVLLERNLEKLLDAGVSGINVSLDTLDPERFREITGSDQLETVLGGIFAAAASGVPVKVNTVLQRGRQEEWRRLALLAKEFPVDVRFIEMMPIGVGTAYEAVNNDEILRYLQEAFPGVTEERTVRGNGPAGYVRVPGFLGRIGFISPLHGKFCATCNRIRLTASGKLKPCLCYGEGMDIRRILREYHEPDRSSLLKKALEEAILSKPREHCFEQKGRVTEHALMSAIGG